MRELLTEQWLLTDMEGLLYHVILFTESMQGCIQISTPVCIACTTYILSGL